MGKIAFVFAGQGAQYTGMGQDLYENSAAARAVFELVDGVRPGTSTQCFTADKQQLSQTEITQPTMFAVDLACAVALAEQGVMADGVAGFSLGEWPAVAFSGILSKQEAFALTVKRAQAMQKCAEEHPGAMVAVLRLTAEQVAELCSSFTEVWPVNYNCPGQTVVAGNKEQISQFCEQVAAAKGRAMPLAVSGAFHSPYMAEAADYLAAELTQVTLKQPQFPIYANVTGELYDEAAALLAAQVKSPVKWQKTIEHMVSDGFVTFIEVGPGKTLVGLIKKINKDVAVYNVENWQTLQATVQSLKGE